MPLSNTGFPSPVIPHVNEDGSLDIAWLDYANGQGDPSAVSQPAPIFITRVNASLDQATTVATGVDSYSLLGFCKDVSGSSYVAFNQDHSFKAIADGDRNNVNGNVLGVSKLGSWQVTLFGTDDNNTLWSKGAPGGAASSVLGHDSTNNRLVLYLGHNMLWDDGVRHQAGYLRLLDPDSGAAVAPAEEDPKFGPNRWYSHNFNQRLVIADGKYYVLAHGDSFPRGLGFARWSPDGYLSGSGNPDFNAIYWDVSGEVGDNNTQAETGQLARLADGQFAIVHTTSQGRTARDVRIALASPSDGSTQASAWLTENTANRHATMVKVGVIQEHILVTYAIWPGEGHELELYAMVLDQELKPVVPATPIADAEFIPSAPLIQFPAGPHAGQLGWVSGNDAHSLTVTVVKLD